MVQIDEEKLDQLVGTSEAAEYLGVDASDIRRWTKAGKVPGAVKVLGRYGYDLNELDDFEPPEDGAGRGTNRVDPETGATIYRWKLWATREQKEELEAEGFEIENPRKKARARREARAEEEEEETEEQVEEQTDDDPFADFDA